LGFEQFECNEGEFMSMMDPMSRCFKGNMITRNNVREEYQYLEKYVYNPLPEEYSEKFLNFSFITSDSEIKIMTSFFGALGIKNKEYKKKDDFYRESQRKSFMKKYGFAQTFLYKVPKMIKSFIESGNGNFLGTLIDWIFDRFKSSVLQSDSNSRSLYFESEKKLAVPKSIIEAIKLYKNKHQKKLEYEGYENMDNRRIIGNHSIRTSIYRDGLMEITNEFDHLMMILFNLEVRNISINLDYGIFSHAIQVISKDSFNKYGLFAWFTNY
jgi:hypothetical protein